jgi:hypothetical protein
MGLLRIRGEKFGREPPGTTRGGGEGKDAISDSGYASPFQKR